MRGMLWLETLGPRSRTDVEEEEEEWGREGEKRSKERQMMGEEIKERDRETLGRRSGNECRQTLTASDPLRDRGEGGGAGGGGGGVREADKEQRQQQREQNANAGLQERRHHSSAASEKRGEEEEHPNHPPGGGFSQTDADLLQLTDNGKTSKTQQEIPPR